jgi:DNA-binding CsgD family transcriptional regulator
MFEGLCRLIGAPAASGGEGRWVRPSQFVEALSAFGAGYDADTRALYAAYMRDVTPARDPIFCALQRIPGRLVTHTRRELVSDAAWRRSAVWNDYYRPCHHDDHLVSVCQTSNDTAVSVITIHRALGEREFSPRERQLLRFFHAELGRLVGHALVSVTEPDPHKLSPRMRQTLACLLEGETEKQVAARLGLSHATTHQYVMALYRHFAVTSRAQLMAHVIRRMGRGLWRSAPAPEIAPGKRMP